MSRLKRILIFGSGRWAMNFLSASVRVSSVEVAGLVSGRALDHFGPTPVFRSVSDAMRVTQVDGAVLATNPQSNRQTLRDVFNLSIPVLCEKPVVLAHQFSSKADMILYFSELEKYSILVNHYQSGHARFLGWLETFCIRHVVAIRIYEGSCGPLRSYGALHDWGPHALAVLLLIVGFGADPKILDVKCSECNAHEIWNVSLSIDGIAASPLAVNLCFGNGFCQKRRAVEIVMADGNVTEFDFTEETSWIDLSNRDSTDQSDYEYCDMFEMQLNRLRSIIDKPKDTIDHSLLMAKRISLLLYDIDKVSSISLSDP